MPTHTKRKDLARILRAVLRLVENDVRELADAVVEIDHKTADTRANVARLEEATLNVASRFNERICSLEQSGFEESIAGVLQRLEALEALVHPTPHSHSIGV